MTTWKNLSGTWIRKKPLMPGVWLTKEGKYLVRARPTNTRTGKLVEIKRVISAENPRDAYKQLQTLIAEVKAGPSQRTEKIRFAEYAQHLFRERVEMGELRSEATKTRWQSMINNHLAPAFGDYYMDKIERRDVVDYRNIVARRCAAGEISPRTGEGWLKLLKVILRHYVEQNDLSHDPTRGIKGLDHSVRRVYTQEEPNSLLVHEYVRFMQMMRVLYPRHYAMTLLGFVTGLRTCTLRALRRKGVTPDVNFTTGRLLNRRSHTIAKGKVLERTKTGRDQDIPLPPELLDVLRAHIAALRGAQVASDLLFPALDGKEWDPDTLRTAFLRVRSALGLAKRITPHGMRRTNKDLFRAIGTSQVVSMAVSGHVTEAMHRHYSTVGDEEMRASIANVLSLLTGADNGKVADPNRSFAAPQRRKTPTPAPAFLNSAWVPDIGEEP